MTVAEIARLRRHNLLLQRRLERARKDALLYAASLCEDHVVVGDKLKMGRDGVGPVYAAKLREIAE